MTVLGLKCGYCGKEYSVGRWFEGCVSCKSPGFASGLQVVYDWQKAKQTFTRERLEANQKRGLERFLDLLPVDPTLPFNALGVGNTPLIECRRLASALGLGELYIKDESRNVTGTFKDRYACIGANVALQFDSSCLIAAGGNMGTAAAAFAARYGLAAISIEVPTESTIAMLQTLAYGGKVILVEDYKIRYSLMKRCVDEYGCHPLSSYTSSPTGDPYSREGAKTIAYEICQDLSWEVPDVVVAPVGQGFLLWGLWRGFLELHKLGLVERLPMMIAAESAAGGSYTKTLKAVTDAVAKVLPTRTVARHAVASQGSYQGLQAIRDSGGTAITVSDDESVEALKTLASMEGLLPSTTSSVALAALVKLCDEGKISKKQRIVCVLTGAGFKDFDLLSGVFPQIPSLNGPDWDNFVAALSHTYGSSGRWGGDIGDR